MKTEMESVLRAGVSIGKFQAGTVTVESTGMENILGIVKAYVKLRAFSEIHDVEIYLTYANPTQ
jgi:serine protease inhibitor